MKRLRVPSYIITIANLNVLTVIEIIINKYGIGYLMNYIFYLSLFL
jgi:hypothetical protein